MDNATSKDYPVPAKDLSFRFIRGSGPGGQKINRTASTVQLFFDIHNNSTLTEEVKRRLIKIAGKKVTETGLLIITASEHRTQQANRRAAVERLTNLITAARKKPKVRRPTTIPRAEKAKRLADKKHRSRIKALRKTPNPDD